jgi:hypothetical protein
VHLGTSEKEGALHERRSFIYNEHYLLESSLSIDKDIVRTGRRKKSMYPTDLND